MKTFLTEDFLLHSDFARELYHDYAKAQPIFDYHSHLCPMQVAENKKFSDMSDVWLQFDHYKWRAMRANGVAERFCTGDASSWEKFEAFAGTVPKTLRNPLYHWTHLELQRYFGIDDLLDSSSAREIWEKGNAVLQNLPVQEILKQSNVAVICTTDDPIDDLAAHKKIRASDVRTRVYPTFRPDRALLVEDPAAFNTWTDKLSAISGIDCSSFTDFLSAIEKRHTAFHEIGGRLSDHGLKHCDSVDCTEAEAARVFDEARAGRAASPEQAAKYRTFLMVFFGQLDAAKGWTKQLHIGAQRNNNSRLHKALGVDAGFDSIGDWPQAASLAGYLDRLDRDNRLPKTILYNLNPSNNYLFASMAGNFQDGSVAGKIQFGSGWWFLDQKEGMEWQINALSNLGLLSHFVGMLTDSRSFLSFPRHEYFRRILCNMIGRDVENGEAPRDIKLLGKMVSDICYGNAEKYFGLEVPAES